MIRICIRPVSAFVALALSLGVALPALGGSPFLDDDDEDDDAGGAGDAGSKKDDKESDED